jgi:hypothetical protein
MQYNYVDCGHYMTAIMSYLIKIFEGIFDSDLFRLNLNTFKFTILILMKLNVLEQNFRKIYFYIFWSLDNYNNSKNI